MSNQYTFKSSFAGFRRGDVIDYIEKLNNEFYTYRTESEATIDRLNDCIARLEAQLAARDSEPVISQPPKRTQKAADRDTQKQADPSQRLEGFVEKIEEKRNSAENKGADNQTQPAKSEKVGFSRMFDDKTQTIKTVTSRIAARKNNGEELLDDFDEQFIKQLKEILADY